MFQNRELISADSSLRGGLRRLGHFWYGYEPPHALCVFRILIGVYYLVGWLSVLPRVELYYSSEGMAFPYLTPSAASLTGWPDWLARLTQPPVPQVAWLLYACMILLIVLIVVGWWTRVALMLFLAMYSYYWLLQIHSLQSSFDRLLFVITVFLALGDCDAVYSLQAWYRRRQGIAPVDRIAIWPARLIAAQIAFLYFGEGIVKALLPAWSNGNILYYSLQSDWSTPLSFWVLQLDLPKGVYDGAVLMTIVMEMSAPFFLFHPVWQKLFFVYGFFFHLAIGLLMNIWPFMIMPLTYVLFVEPESFRQFCDKLTNQFRSKAKFEVTDLSLNKDSKNVNQSTLV